jgi:hypothetical protein
MDESRQFACSCHWVRQSAVGWYLEAFCRNYFGYTQKGDGGGGRTQLTQEVSNRVVPSDPMHARILHNLDDDHSFGSSGKCLTLVLSSLWCCRLRTTVLSSLYYFASTKTASCHVHITIAEKISRVCV